MKTSPDESQRLTREQRVRRQADFDLVYRRGDHAADATLVIQARRNGLPVSRLGLSVSRRVGNAVVRNRWKRSIREVFRRQRPHLPVGWDLVVRPRRGAVLSYGAIERSLPSLLRRIQRKRGGARS